MPGLIASMLLLHMTQSTFSAIIGIIWHLGETHLELY